MDSDNCERTLKFHEFIREELGGRVSVLDLYTLDRLRKRFKMTEDAAELAAKGATEQSRGESKESSVHEINAPRPLLSDQHLAEMGQRSNASEAQGPQRPVQSLRISVEERTRSLQGNAMGDQHRELRSQRNSINVGSSGSYSDKPRARLFGQCPDDDDGQGPSRTPALQRENAISPSTARRLQSSNGSSWNLNPSGHNVWRLGREGGEGGSGPLWGSSRDGLVAEDYDESSEDEEDECNCPNCIKADEVYPCMGN